MNTTQQTVTFGGYDWYWESYTIMVDGKHVGFIYEHYEIKTYRDKSLNTGKVVNKFYFIDNYQPSPFVLTQIENEVIKLNKQLEK